MITVLSINFNKQKEKERERKKSKLEFRISRKEKKKGKRCPPFHIYKYSGLLFFELWIKGRGI